MSWVTHGPVGLGADARDLHAAAGQVHQDQHGEAGQAAWRPDLDREAVGGGWGNTITALTASQTSIRGAHPARLRLDEADEMRLPILEAAQGQTMDQGAVRAQTVDRLDPPASGRHDDHRPAAGGRAGVARLSMVLAGNARALSK